MRLDDYRLIYLLMMPRVVADQRHKFDTDDLFVRFRQISQVHYSGSPFGSEMEKRNRFLQDCHERRIEITFVPNGFNLELHMAPAQEATGVAQDSLDLDSEPPKVHLCSHFILNGVCVRWRGWIDRNTLLGQGRLEFDAVRAQIEHEKLQQELRAIQERRHEPGQPGEPQPEQAEAAGSASPSQRRTSDPPTPMVTDPA